jgi:putative PIG3 family NAD(P)H quinone oxidoreductase
MSASLPDTMNAWRIIQDGSGRMEKVRLPLPQPGADEVLIRVAHAGINRAALCQREGSYPAPLETQYVPGLEVAGEIAARGGGVTAWAEGDFVCALVAGGGYAEYCVAPARQVLPVPTGLAMTAAAALPEVLATSWLALVETARLKPGETVLVHGGASGVGTLAIQLARLLGAQVIATAGTEEKCAACRALGAKSVNYREEDFSAYAKAATEGRGVDVVLDILGGNGAAERNLKALAARGRMVTIALMSGARCEVNLAGLLMKNLSWHGLTLRSRSPEEKAETLRQMQKNVWPALAERRLMPLIDRVYPLAEVEKAHERMQERLHLGKIILSM